MSAVNHAGFRLPAQRGLGRLWLKTGARANGRAKTEGADAVAKVSRPPRRGKLVGMGSAPRKQSPAGKGPPRRDSLEPALAAGMGAVAGAERRCGRGRRYGRRHCLRGCLRGGAGVRGDGAWVAHRRAPAGDARAGDRQPLERAAAGALRAGDRAGRDGAAAVDGGRVQGRGHRRAHRADRALLDAAGRAGRDGAGLLRDAQSCGAAARRGQGRDSRRDPAEARTS